MLAASRPAPAGSLTNLMTMLEGWREHVPETPAAQIMHDRTIAQIEAQIMAIPVDTQAGLLWCAVELERILSGEDTGEWTLWLAQTLVAGIGA